MAWQSRVASHLLSLGQFAHVQVPGNRFAAPPSSPRERMNPLQRASVPRQMVDETGGPEPVATARVGSETQNVCRRGSEPGLPRVLGPARSPPPGEKRTIARRGRRHQGALDRETVSVDVSVHGRNLLGCLCIQVVAGAFLGSNEGCDHVDSKRKWKAVVEHAFEERRSVRSQDPSPWTKGRGTITLISDLSGDATHALAREEGRCGDASTFSHDSRTRISRDTPDSPSTWNHVLLH